MEYLIFLNGVMLGAFTAVAVGAFKLHVGLKEKRDLLNTQTSELLKSIAESHNTLNGTIAAIDKRVTETSLRVDSLVNRKVTMGRIPGL